MLSPSHRASTFALLELLSGTLSGQYLSQINFCIVWKISQTIGHFIDSADIDIVIVCIEIASQRFLTALGSLSPQQNHLHHKISTEPVFSTDSITLSL